VAAGIRAGERVVSRQLGQGIAAAELDGPGIAIGHVSKGVQEGDAQVERLVRRRAGRRGEAETGRAGRMNGDGQGAGDAGSRRVRPGEWRGAAVAAADVQALGAWEQVLLK